ncbi:MAG: Wadjet anti-phage system protein JetD domain-containing protein [Myxococcota bacterium]
MADDAERAGALELWQTGTLRVRGGTKRLAAELESLGWLTHTARRRERALVEDARGHLAAFLDRRFPAWRETLDALRERGLEPSPEALARLRSLERQRSIASWPIPDRINRRSAAGLLADHSKAPLPDSTLDPVGAATLTSDSVLRIRPNRGLKVRRGGEVVDATRVANVLGELMLTERALMDDLRFASLLPRAILTVENRAPYVDLHPPDHLMLVHAPGKETTLAIRLLRDLLPDVPALHFGDLDPEGVAIFRQMQREVPRLRLLVPEFWRDRLPTHALAKTWPADLDLADLPPLVQDLARFGRWLEQESVALDPRMGPLLESLLAGRT